jgi:ubiquinone/menaquinone biosynthesis C-methylase UbiE/uncharacterized protein YbaR (Trm112 family)
MSTKKVNLYEHLICPDDKAKLEMRKQLTCMHCGRVFTVADGIVDLLPTELSAADVAEEDFWSTDPREGVKAHPLLALVHKGDVLLQFYEQVLPDLKLHGKVLELGSGTCWLSSLIKVTFPETFVLTTDVSHSALVKGIQVSEFVKTKIDRFVTCKVEKLPFEDDFFDYVVGSAVLHHTIPEKALPEIYRVLKNGGSYIGIWELAIPRILGIFWGSRLGLAGRAEREVGSKEGNYSLRQWKKFFEDAGFEEVTISLERDPKYKHYHWFIGFYYKIVSGLPEAFVRRFLACNIKLTAKKKAKI